MPGSRSRRLAGWLLLALLAGCATASEPQIQRAAQGPTAEEIYRVRFVRGYGRLPSFDESSAWRADHDRRVGDYLMRHPEVGTSPRASQFRFERRVALGMSKEEVTLLVGPPDAVTSDETIMQTAAGPFWPHIRANAKEMWVYPSGWQLYFDGDRLTDLTVAGKAPIE